MKVIALNSSKCMTNAPIKGALALKLHVLLNYWLMSTGMDTVSISICPLPVLEV